MGSPRFTSRLAISEDVQEVALCARILLYEHDARIAACAPKPVSTIPVQRMEAQATVSPATPTRCKSTAVNGEVMVEPGLLPVPPAPTVTLSQSKIVRQDRQLELTRTTQQPAGVVGVNVDAGLVRATAMPTRMHRQTECGEVLQGRGSTEVTAAVARQANSRLTSSGRTYSGTHAHQRRVVTLVLPHGGKGSRVEAGVRASQRPQKRSCVPASPVMGSKPRPNQRLSSDFFAGAP